MSASTDLGTTLGARPPNRLILFNKRTQSTAIPFLDFFSLCHGRPESDGNVVGQLVATHRDHTGVLYGPFGKYGYIRGAASDIHKRYAQFSFIGGQYGFC
jgi:hypothetical protein